MFWDLVTAVRDWWVASAITAHPTDFLVLEYKPMMTATEVFVVRVYRREPDDADRVSGVVEVVRVEKERALGVLAELMEIV